MMNYSNSATADRWEQLLELFASNLSSKHQYLDTYQEEEKSLT